MTHNQIDFARLQEDKRHNRAVLAETTRHNQEVEAWNKGTLAETNRHNLVTEDLTLNHNTAQQKYWMDQNSINAAHLFRMDAETARHNQATERLESLRNEEVIRHNQSSELQLRNELAEASRHNRAYEATQAINAAASRVQAESASRQAQAAERNAETRVLEYASQHDVNQSSAALNRAREQESLAYAESKQQEIGIRRWTAPSQIINEATGSLRNLSSTVNSNLRTALIPLEILLDNM